MDGELEHIAELALEESRLARKERAAMTASADAQRADPMSPEAAAAFQRFREAGDKRSAAMQALRSACYCYDGIIGAARNGG